MLKNLGALGIAGIVILLAGIGLIASQNLLIAAGWHSSLLASAWSSSP